MKQHHCYKESVITEDSLGGIDFRSILSSGDWTTHLQYFERQKYDWDDEGCIIYQQQESIDAQIDELISQGLISTELITLFNQMGFMDSVNSLDSQAHFHSSPRYLQSLTGNGFDGNALPDPVTAAQKFGIIPWTSLPFDATITEAEYLLNPMPQNLLDIGQQFLLAVGGENWIKGKWIVKALPTNTQAMDLARQQAPVGVAVLAEAPDWNQYEPPIPSGPPCHGVLNYNSLPTGELILDHYSPFEKLLQTGFPIPEAYQGIVNIIPPPPAPTPPSPTFPADPTPAQEVQWYDWIISVLKWLKILEE